MLIQGMRNFGNSILFIQNIHLVHRPVETNEFLPFTCFLNRNMQRDCKGTLLTETTERTLARFTRLLRLGLVFNHSFRILALLVEGSIFSRHFITLGVERALICLPDLRSLNCFGLCVGLKLQTIKFSASYTNSRRLGK